MPNSDNGSVATVSWGKWNGIGEKRRIKWVFAWIIKLKYWTAGSWGRLTETDWKKWAWSDWKKWEWSD